MINFEYIREYLVLAETLNFSKAAEQTYITQPGLSRHIAAIEEEMGAKLFERNTRNVWLTPAGEVVRDQFKDILRSYDYAKTQVARLEKESGGILTVNSPYFWDEEFTEPVVDALYEAHPDCNVSITSLQPDDGMLAMNRGQGDIAVDMEKMNIDPSVRRVPFAVEHMGVAVGRNHRLFERESVKLEELAGERFVALELDVSDYGNYNTFMLDLLAARGIRPESLVYAEQVSGIGIKVRESGGVCILPWGAKATTRSYLHMIPLEDEDCRFTMCLYYQLDNGNKLIPEFVQAALSLEMQLRDEWPPSPR